MDDMNAFERLVAGEVQRAAEPARPVDDLALYSAVDAATQSPKWRFQSMFSATRLVVAGAIVALFGSFLLAGVLTQPSDVQQPGVAASATATPDASSESTVVPPTEVFARVSPDSGGPGGGTGRVEASDPRLAGHWSRRGVGQGWVGGGTVDSERLAAFCDEDGCGPRQLELRLEAQRIENDGGTWTSRPTAAPSRPVPDPFVPSGLLLIFDGSDGYEGLVAVLYKLDLEYWGFIVDADELPSNPGGADAPFPDVDPSWEAGE